MGQITLDQRMVEVRRVLAEVPQPYRRLYPEIINCLEARHETTHLRDLMEEMRELIQAIFESPSLNGGIHVGSPVAYKDRNGIVVRLNKTRHFDQEHLEHAVRFYPTDLRWPIQRRVAPDEMTLTSLEEVFRRKRE